MSIIVSLLDAGKEVLLVDLLGHPEVPRAVTLSNRASCDVLLELLERHRLLRLVLGKFLYVPLLQAVFHQVKTIFQLVCQFPLLHKVDVEQVEVVECLGLLSLVVSHLLADSVGCLSVSWLELPFGKRAMRFIERTSLRKRCKALK